ncbi:glycosyltransferase family 8 protein [Hymenobacter sp. BT188]|uniref:glycosyltransferase family 8 protein n=1 Tax=Hymenobacter sp. BT188 TaxID=2763504 RepID=UPI0016513DA0|nr:glycosyltransferase family 8 protein [Hymenobacter sp. BT188]MBC6608747.1 glycosyltransferase family 8 protein [Hymenobacter sp. BT188]
MDIVFNVNPGGLEGLGATLTSLIRNCSNSQELKIWFLCSDFQKKDKFNISKLLESEGFSGSTEYIDFNARQLFGHLTSLHGDWTTYGRLLIANYVKSDVALYLDADLIVLLDVLQLRNFDLQDAIVAGVYGSTLEWTLDRDFFINQLKASPEQSYFNCGIILFNLKKWREDNIEEQWKELANQYCDKLISHDQTIINAICGGEFTHLPSSFNNAWYPGQNRPQDADHSILHFVGSPKPWDLFGSVLHKGHKTWNTYTPNAWKKAYGNMSREKIRRFWKIRRSIVRHLRTLALNMLTNQE